jgi:hypothetical protein
MIIDAFTEVSTAQALTTTAVSTNSIDLGTSGRNIAIGEPITFEMVVDVALASGTSVKLEIIQATAANLTGDVAVLNASPVVITADLTAGAKVRATANSIQSLEPGSGGVGLQYLGVRYTIAGTFDAGTVTTYFVPANALQDADQYHGQV